MHKTWQLIRRDVSTAFAVLTLYALILLLPLHQAAGLQRDLDAIGYAALDTWSVCQPLAQQSGAPDDATIAKCPATGVAKHKFAGPAPAAITLDPPTRSFSVAFAAPFTGLAPILPDHIGQSRAPPAPV